MKPLLVVAAAVLVLIVGSRLRKDDSLGISGMTFGEMTHSLGEAVEQEPFCDAEWSNDDESAVLLTFNDQAANAYEIYFSLFDSGTQARIDAAYINGIVFDDVELTYLLEYLDTGDFEEFETDLSSYALVSAILY